jgi:hypothetical protein
MWSKNQELKDQFVKVLEEFIVIGKINTNSEFPSLHKILSDPNSSYFKQFYDKLYKSEGGKDFVFNEFTSRLTELKKETKEKSVENFI